MKKFGRPFVFALCVIVILVAVWKYESAGMAAVGAAFALLAQLIGVAPL